MEGLSVGKSNEYVAFGYVEEMYRSGWIKDGNHCHGMISRTYHVQNLDTRRLELKLCKNDQMFEIIRLIV